MMDAENDSQAERPEQPEQPEGNKSGPARELMLHLVRMLETRADAAGIALQSEIHTLSTRLQLHVIAGVALFIALWGGIVLLAIVLPAHLRVPVLSTVVALFVVGGVWALLAAKRAMPSRDVGSMSWFLDGLKLDLEVLSRSLAKPRAEAAEEPRSQPNDLAA